MNLHAQGPTSLGSTQHKADGPLQVCAPLDGTTAALSSVPHPVFATGSAGAGIAVVPDPGVEVVDVAAPITGTLVRVQPHLFVVEALVTGVRVLVNIGIDTDKLRGRGYSTRLEEGAEVRAGAPVVTYAPKEIGRMGFDPIVVVVAMSHDFMEITVDALPGEPCSVTDLLFEV